ncbi:MAG: small multi-drug export protein [Vallitaleaceae bacterium]|jgi:uncharacterized membrane protein|nr:small multi-drug export protein [Vallitaleaceae bacterium]
MNEALKIIESIFMAAIPVLEQKAAIPFAMEARFGFFSSGVSLSMWQAYLFTLLGAVLPAAFILLFIPRVFQFLKRFKGLGKLVEWYEHRSMKKGKNIVRYEQLGLFLFVALPLPFTGVWTGSAVAALIGLEFKKSIVTVIAGAMVCGWIVMAVYLGLINLFWM